MANRINEEENDSGGVRPLMKKKRVMELAFNGSEYLWNKARTDGSGPPVIKIGKEDYCRPAVLECQRSIASRHKQANDGSNFASGRSRRCSQRRAFIRRGKPRRRSIPGAFTTAGLNAPVTGADGIAICRAFRARDGLGQYGYQGLSP